MTDDHLDAIVQQLLTPLAGAEPTGRWMRYERVFTDIVRLREEDNPHLPMGEWERPLVKADWRKVAEACHRMLAEDTKDFQVAAWLCDAWIRTAELKGLCAGLTLIAELAERYWTSGWPALDADDADRRVAPFTWMNAHLPLTLRLNTLLLPSALHRDMPISLFDWERAPSGDDAHSADDERLNRREIRDSVKSSDGDWLRHIAQQAAKALTILDRLSNFLDTALKETSPSLSKLTDAIQRLQRASQSLLQELPLPVDATPATEAADVIDETNTTPVADTATAIALPIDSAPNAIHNRQQAYTALASIAAYLQTIEPHSPTPYLIQRAVELGQLSLPDMIKDVSSSAGSLDKFFELLGISPLP